MGFSISSALKCNMSCKCNKILELIERDNEDIAPVLLQVEIKCLEAQANPSSKFSLYFLKILNHIFSIYSEHKNEGYATFIISYPLWFSMLLTQFPLLGQAISAKFNRPKKDHLILEMRISLSEMKLCPQVYLP